MSRRRSSDGESRQRPSDALREGWCVAQGDRFAVQHRPGDGGDVALIRPAELVERGDAGGVGGGGDHGFGAEYSGHPFGQFIGADAAAVGVPTDDGNGVARRVVDADHRRVGVLAGEQGSEQPDRRPDGEEADERVAFRPGLA